MDLMSRLSSMDQSHLNEIWSKSFERSREKEIDWLRNWSTKDLGTVYILGASNIHGRAYTYQEDSSLTHLTNALDSLECCCLLNCKQQTTTNPKISTNNIINDPIRPHLIKRTTGQRDIWRLPLPTRSATTREYGHGPPPGSTQ